MYAGEYTYETDILQKNSVSIPSSNVIDFAKYNIIKGINYPNFIHEKGCGEEKGCFAYPSGCIKYATCSLLATYEITKFENARHGTIHQLYVELKVLYILTFSR